MKKPKLTIPEPTLLDRLSKEMQQRVDFITDLHQITGQFAEFLGTATPYEVALLANILSERETSQLNLRDAVRITLCALPLESVPKS